MKASENTVLITGGASGIGLALAKKFLALGNTVLITGRDRRKLEGVRQQHPEVGIFSCDLALQEGLDALVLYVEQHYGKLNVLVNNAAVQYAYDLMEEPGLLFRTEREIATNFTAPVKLTGMLLPTLIHNPGAAVINVSSGLFIAPKRSAPVYCATKAALHSYSKSLRYQLEDRGIKVFEIIPPLVDTPMTAGRGSVSISAERLAEIFFRDFTRNIYESYIGKSRLLKWISRLTPALADRLMKNGT